MGSVVGLGNIWEFIYLTGANGGGAFLLAYLLCVALVGIPIMACEFYIGRKSGKTSDIKSKYGLNVKMLLSMLRV